MRFAFAFASIGREAALRHVSCRGGRARIRCLPGCNEENMQRPNFSLEGRVAVITGGARGIGGAIASALGSAGAAVALLGRDDHALAEHAATLTAEGCNA